MNELGDMVTVTLAVEIMGRCSNLVLINSDGKIIDSIKRVDEEISRERLVLPGMTYTLPPRDSRLNFLDFTKEELKAALDNTKNAELSKCLIKIFEGISPVIAREWTFYAGKGRDCTKEDLTEDEFDRLYFYIKKLPKA